MVQNPGCRIAPQGERTLLLLTADRGLLGREPVVVVQRLAWAS